MEETLGSRDSEPVRRPSLTAVVDRDEEITLRGALQQSSAADLRDVVQLSSRRNQVEEQQLTASSSQMTEFTAHHRRPPTTKSTTRSPTTTSSSTGGLHQSDDVTNRSGTPPSEEQQQTADHRLRPPGLGVEPAILEQPATCRAGSVGARKTSKSPSEGLLGPHYGPLASKNPLHGALFNSFQITDWSKSSQEGLLNLTNGGLFNSFQSEGSSRATKSPPPPGPITSRVTAFSVSDILDPAKFGGGAERREKVDPRVLDPRLSEAAARLHQRSAAASVGTQHELWSPWMERLSLQLRAGVNNINFLRAIGQC